MKSVEVVLGDNDETFIGFVWQLLKIIVHTQNTMVRPLGILLR